MKDSEIKKDNQELLDIRVPKESVFLAIEKGLAEGANKSHKKGWLIFGFIAITLFISTSIVFFTNPALADTIANIFGGAKLEKVDPAQEPEVAPKEIEEEEKVQQKYGIEPLKIDHGNQVTQEMLMKYWWAVVDESPNIYDNQTIPVFKYTETEVILSQIDKVTGAEVPIEYAAGQSETTMAYTLVGDVIEEKIYLSSQVLQNYFQASWVEDVLVLFPNDEYDHKDERKRMLQPVKLVE
ncbi:hypothetical protein [Isobaculum melis]|uniref:Uncharacterized protein n=1 Tax=Isobaculum melis TaxID=142588 RepID=A0A1H9PSY7_9LACT|nr:hypothetical protein [Isobaculum melis]SER51248.1 hypothetical protein SAMN04488559_101114 [Isobaculum melis]